MHNVSLRNYATGLPHHREQKWHSHAHRPQSRGFDRFSKSGPNCPFCEEKRQSSDSLAGICMKQEPGGPGTPYLLFCREPHHSLCFAEGPPPATPIRPIFGYAILNEKFPRKLCQSWATPKGVIRN